MRIYYLSPYDVLRPRTNQIGDVRLCEGFAENGSEVELIVPYIHRADNLKQDEVFPSYDVRTPFRITMLRTPFWDGLSQRQMLVGTTFYMCFVLFRILLQNAGRLADVVIMSRNEYLLLPFLVARKVLFLGKGPVIVPWIHEVKVTRLRRWVYQEADAVVGTNPSITEDLGRKVGLPEQRLAFSLNPITEKQLERVISQEEARARVEVPTGRPLVVYTGKLFVGQEETGYLLDAARRLRGYNFLFTGGKPEVVDHYRKACRDEGMDNVFFTGYLPDYSQVRYYQFAADVLVSYYSTREHDVRYNLPNKICEYMLTRHPIVTCRFPAVRGTLSEGSAVFVEPENAEALTEGIRRAVEDRAAAQRTAEQAFREVQDMTFKKRTKVLLDFFATLHLRPAPVAG